MTSHDVLQPIAPPTAAPNVALPPTTKVDGLSFERVLESLRKMSQAQRTDAPAGEVRTETDVATLQDALRAADDGFVSAMDLRQKLEAAFRAHRP